MDAGLKPGLLTLQGEKRKHSGDRARYMKVRDYVLTAWGKDRTRYLGREACVAGYVGEEGAEFVEEVYAYLNQTGCINVGVLKNDPLVCVPASAFGGGGAAGGEKGAGGEEEAEEAEVPEASIQGALYGILEEVNMDEVTEKAIRQRLAEHFGSSMDGKRRKKLIKRLVAEYIQCGGTPSSWKEAYLKSKASRYAKVVVVGAGPAGLMAGLHLKRHGCDVTVLEARGRVGGRVHSFVGEETGAGAGAGRMGAPCDLGASIITGRACDTAKGYRADPSALLCEQLGIELHDVNFGNLPIYVGDNGGSPRVVNAELDDMVGHVMDELLDRQAAYCEKLPLEEQNRQNLGALVDQARARWEEETAEKVARKMASRERVTVELELRVVGNAVEVGLSLDVAMGDGWYSSDDDDFPPEQLPKTLTDDHDRLLGWHWAHLEYGNSAPIKLLSAPHWNDDEDMGGFGGPHSFVVGGYDQPFRRIAELLDVRTGARVSEIEVDADRAKNSVTVVTEDEKELVCDAVLVTVPLGVLKRRAISFSPELPQWKKDAIDRMGFGKLDKVFLEFEEAFWDDSVDYFGVDKDNTEATRGLCFMFWNLHRFCGKPILVALISGEAAHANEGTPAEQLRDAAVGTLRSVFGGAAVPAPVAYHVTKWGQDIDTCGSYSFTAVGASPKDYEMLARPVGRRVFFAGEHTCQEHPDTVGGAMLTGLREASRILEMDNADEEDGAGVGGEALVSKKRKAVRAGAERETGKANGAGGAAKAKSTASAKGNVKGNAKAKANGGGDDGGDDGEAADLARVLPKDLASRVSRDRMGEEARLLNREVAKGMWKALMAAEGGDTSLILHSLRFADDARQEVGSVGIAGIVSPLVEAASETLTHVFKDESCLQILVDWVDEMNDLTSDPARVKDLLLLLKAFALTNWNAIGQSKGRSRLQLLVVKVGQHPDNGVKIAAKRVVQKMQNLDIFSDDDFASPEQKRKTVPREVGGDKAFKKAKKQEAKKQEAKKQEAKKQEAEKQAAKAGAAPKTATATATTTRFDDETQRKLDEAEAEIRAMEAEAERLRSQAATHDKAADAVVDPPAPFENFEASDKNPKDEFRRRLDGAIAEALKSHYQSGRISKESYKAILQKSGEKIMAKTTEKDWRDWRGFYGSRRGSLRKLVDGYVAAYASRRAG